jgi:hypothetical protein
LRKIFSFLFFFLLAQSSFAALPFVTDDASISDPNQLSLETFVENWRIPQKRQQESGNLVGSYLGGSLGVAKNLELTLGGLVGYNFQNGNLNVGNPIFQAKTMAYISKKDLRIPSIAIAVGYANRNGRDQYFDPANNGYFLGIATSKFFDGDFVIHLNFGAKASYNISNQSDFSRAHLGVAFDVALNKKLRAIAESYNGAPNSPRDSYGYFHSYQVGLRFLKSSNTSFHILYQTQPTFAGYDENNRMFYRHTSSVQIGMRKIIDDLF